MLVLNPDISYPHDSPKSFFRDRSSVSDGLSLLELPHNVAVLLEKGGWWYGSSLPTPQLDSLPTSLCKTR